MLKRALFPGDSEIDQLYKIFRILGTPNENIWKGVSAFPEYKPSFPVWTVNKLKDCVPFHDDEEMEFLMVI